MEFYEVLKTRRSIRAYKSDPVPEAALRRIAEAAQCAPSACNRQPWKLVAVRNAALRKRICEVYRNPFLAQAPVILLALGDASTAWQRPGDDHSIVEIDLGIMFEHAVLAAAAEGLGSCWICAFERAKMDAAAGISAPWTVLAVSPARLCRRRAESLPAEAVGGNLRSDRLTERAHAVSGSRHRRSRVHRPG
ncbi:MAG: nitroreductase family protein [Lentisphaeria bacterium]|nr:MAG: nitroreductase family protein [Lentisphaeria bacterium]